MALRYLDSFDDYQTADVTKNFTSAVNPTIEGEGRSGSRLSVGTSANKTIDAQTVWIVGFAFRYNATGYDDYPITFLDTGTVQCRLRWLQSDGLLRLYNGDGTLVATGTHVLAQSTWYHVEIKVTINNAGAYEVRINGDSDMSGTGDLYNSGNVSANVIQFGPGKFDDLYILDGSGGVDDAFWGDTTVLSKFPNANGATNNFTPSPVVANYLNVDEAATDYPDENTTYNESGNIGDIDLYDLEDLDGYSEADYDVKGVLVCSVSEKSDAGVKTMRNISRQGVANYAGATYSPSDGSYATFYDAYGTNSPDGNPWTIAAFNALQIGSEIIS